MFWKLKFYATTYRNNTVAWYVGALSFIVLIHCFFFLFLFLVANQFFVILIKNSRSNNSCLYFINAVVKGPAEAGSFSVTIFSIQSHFGRLFFVWYQWKILWFADIMRSDYSQPVFACSKLTIETLEQSVKYVQS